MPRLQLESATDLLDFSGLETGDSGFQVSAGVTGLGLGAKQVQWLEGAGDGSRYRGVRALARDIDLPITIIGRNRAELKVYLSRLAVALSAPATLKFIEDDGVVWQVQVMHTGGGDAAYGKDTDGETYWRSSITLRAGSPYFEAAQPFRKSIKGADVARGLIGKLVNLRLAPSQTIGSITLENTGDAAAYPIWTVYGPGDTFKAVSPSGEVLQWNGTLAAGAALTIDTEAGTVVDQTGANRYAELATAPRLWAVPPGVTTAQCSLLNVTTASTITCTWQPRRWLVV